MILCVLPLLISLTSSETTMTHPSSPILMPYEEIADRSDLPLLNPDLKERQIGKIRLDNGLDVLLISDPGADQSSAAVAVDAGSWDDPDTYPGMAHFCEHMLFMGSQKYPDVEFMKQVSDFGGNTNAFTAPDRTVYMFSCTTEGFPETLDRFAHFFIDPLFEPSNIARELRAVDQEYSKNLDNDAWREYMVFKELSNPGHPNRKFGSGNAQTLSGIPQSALHDWHRAHYGANRMHLFVYSNLPLETLKQDAVRFFSDVPKLAVAPDQTSAQMPLTSPKQRGSIVYIKPIQNKQTLSLAWELPRELSNEPSHATKTIAFALDRGQPNSLYEKLKKEQLIDHLSIDVDDLGGKEHQFFSINLDLSAKGITQIDTVALHCFEALKGLKEQGVPLHLFQEKNIVSKLTYQYQTRKDAFQMAESIGRALPDEPLALFPKTALLAADYSPAKINEILQVLTPDACALTLVAPPTISGEHPDQTEQWFGTEYKVSKVPEKWLTLWKNCGTNPEIKIAGINPFIPAKFDAIALDMAQSEPVLIEKNEGGIAYYARCPEFSAPEAVIHFHIRSPELVPSATSSVLTALYLDHLTDALDPTLSAAKVAGLRTKFELEKCKINLQIAGFSDKAPLLLQTIVSKMANLPLATKEQFDLYYARHEKLFANGSKALPLAQAKDLLESVVMNERTSNVEKLRALQSISYEEFVQYSQKVMKQTHLEALFAGNLSLADAQTTWQKVEQTCNKSVYPKERHTQPKVLSLSPNHGPFILTRSTEAQGNATILAIDEGNFSLSNKAAQEILHPAIREAFFNELRTKQKTGYIARGDNLEIEDRLFHFLMVQSNSHQPEDLLYRFELFFEEYLETLPTQIDLARFQNIKATCIHSLKTRFRNLKDKAGLWNLLAFEKMADFSYVKKRIAALEELSYEQFCDFVQASLSRKNLKRLAVFFEGRLHAPFAYEPIDTPKLLEVSRYEAKSTLNEGVTK